MSIRKPLLPDCFLHWTAPPDQSGDEVLRMVSWRRSLTLKGKAFGAFESQVLPLLTGAHTVDEICGKLAHLFSRDDLMAAFETLAAQGILVEGDGAAPRSDDMHLTPQLGWLAETAPEGRAAQDRLGAAHVVLFGCGAHGAVTARSLVAAGVGRVSVVDPGDVLPSDLYFSGLFGPDDMGLNRAEVLVGALADMPGQTRLEGHATRPADAGAVGALIAGASLVLCCLDGGELNLVAMLNQACRAAGTVWIAASLEGTELVIGPGFFQGEDGPCHMCWRLREIAGAANPETRFATETYLDQARTDLSGRRENLAAAADIVGGLLSAEAVSWLTASAPPSLDGQFLSIAVPGLRMEKHTVLRKPGCTVCGAFATARP